ncbi:MAG: type II secretion system minor pseudopilin GspI [Gammaproteobacteria bacterium]
MCQIKYCLNGKRVSLSNDIVAVILAHSAVIPAHGAVIPAHSVVIPAKAGIHFKPASEETIEIDSRFRGNDSALRGNDSLRSSQAMRTTCGLTLIEVLIALAIVSIAMTAIIKATSQNILGTRYLQDKTIAMWVGEQVLNEARVGVLTLSEDQQTQTTTMLGQDWPWRAAQETTPNSRIKKMSVDVFAPGTEENPIISLDTFVYSQKKMENE